MKKYFEIFASETIDDWLLFAFNLVQPITEFDLFVQKSKRDKEEMPQKRKTFQSKNNQDRNYTKTKLFRH